jgi:hypothetical protein
VELRFLAGRRSESERGSSQVTECLRPESLQPEGTVCVKQQILKMAERRGTMIQRNTEADQGPRTVMTIVSLSKVLQGKLE